MPDIVVVVVLLDLVAGPVRSDLSRPLIDRIGLLPMLMIGLTGAMFQYGNLD